MPGLGPGVRPPAAKLSKSGITGYRRYISAGKSSPGEVAGRQVPNKLPAAIRKPPSSSELGLQLPGHAALF
jgi:hypothetical protein